VAEPLDVQVEIGGGGDVRIDRSRLVLAGRAGVVGVTVPEAGVGMGWMTDA
jgi:hypothetical protein